MAGRGAMMPAARMGPSWGFSLVSLDVQLASSSPRLRLAHRVRVRVRGDLLGKPVCSRQSREETLTHWGSLPWSHRCTATRGC